ncbi:hypothetical protein PAEVO_21990 [Paenibacillus sp. GM2FR]|nr:hypothetical protein PAEVO_21990 [Paenibacillus sp. GM2FR]
MNKFNIDLVVEKSIQLILKTIFILTHHREEKKSRPVGDFLYADVFPAMKIYLKRFPAKIRTIHQ